MEAIAAVGNEGSRVTRGKTSGRDGAGADEQPVIPIPDLVKMVAKRACGSFLCERLRARYVHLVLKRFRIVSRSRCEQQGLPSKNGAEATVAWDYGA